MPRRVTVDQNGLVVLVESLPERMVPTPSKGRASGGTGAKKRTTTKAERVPFAGYRLVREVGKWAHPEIPCPVCKVHVQERRLAKHLRRVHPGYIAGRTSDAEVGKPVATNTVNTPRAKDPAPTRQPDKKPMAVCPRCNASVREDRLTRHLSKVHRSGRSIAEREATGKTDKAERLKREIREIDRSLKKLAPGFHRVKIEELQRQRNALLKELRRPQSAPKSASARSSKKTAGSSIAKHERQEEVRRQYRGEEGRYGGKYLGHMRRELDGRFGSLPLYDDYGEDSGPD